MRILFDHQIFSRQQYGGISRYCLEVASRIGVISSNDVEIFSPLYVTAYKPTAAATTFCRGIHFQKRPGTSVVFGVVNSILGNLIVRPRKDVDIFHETYYADKTYAPESAKRVITVHDMIHELFPESFPIADRTSRDKCVAVERADHVICNSENTRSDLVRIFGTPIEKTCVIYLGHSLTVPDADRDARRDEKPFLLYVGERRGYKNFQFLLNVYASSPTLRRSVDLVCFGGKAFDPEERALLEALGVAGRSVRQLSGSDEFLASLYASAAALVYPSLYEGFGIPPLEAMACGCPVICADAGSLPEVVGDSARMFDPANERELLAAIEDVISDSELAHQLVKAGYERANCFSWERCAIATMKQYERVMQGA